MKLFCNLICLILFSIMTVQAAVPTPDREEHLLTQLRSSDIVQVENALLIIQNEEISSPKIIQSLYEMLDDARPDRRLSRDVIGRSPSKHSYEALTRITGFEPSQPSLLFEESKAELKGFVQFKYPYLLKDDHDAKRTDTKSSQTDVALHQELLIPAESAQSVNDPPPLAQQTSTIQTVASLEQPEPAAQPTAAPPTAAPVQQSKPVVSLRTTVAETKSTPWPWIIGAILVLAIAGGILLKLRGK